MTDKQSTVVVSREEFESSPRFRGMDFQRAPEAPEFYLSPYANGAWDGWKACHALLAATPDQAVDVGEPVAYADPQAFINFTAGIATHEWMWAFSDNGLVPLYRHAQPPAQPRITMADTMRAYQSAARTPHLVGTSNWCAHMAEQLNQCSEVDPQCS